MSEGSCLTWKINTSLPKSDMCHEMSPYISPWEHLYIRSLD